MKSENVRENPFLLSLTPAPDDEGTQARKYLEDCLYIQHIYIERGREREREGEREDLAAHVESFSFLLVSVI